MQRLLFVGSDLKARTRLEGHLGAERVENVRPDAVARLPLSETLLAVVDLDEAGADAVVSLRRAGFSGRVIGFFSHVDEALGRTASEAGAEVYPRGRFWRELGSIVGADP